MSATRVYSVTSVDTTGIRLVRAANPSQALRHVAHSQFEVKPANQDTLIKALSDGVRVEEAGAEPEPEPDLFKGVPLPPVDGQA